MGGTAFTQLIIHKFVLLSVLKDLQGHWGAAINIGAIVSAGGTRSCPESQELRKVIDFLPI